MKRGVFWIALSCLMVASLVLTSCTTKTTSSTSTSTTTKTTATTNITTTTPTKTAAPPTTTGTTTTTTTGNWWDSLGKPQYGGTMTLRINRDIVRFDPAGTDTLTSIDGGWYEQLFAPDWTMDPAIQNFQLGFWSDEYAKGQLLESWEFTAPGTLVLHVRHGIHWQDIPPANGREFNAHDIEYHFDRLFGLGNGFTTPAPYWGTVAQWKSLISVTATDNYTLVMKWNENNQEVVMETFEAADTDIAIECPDAVKQWGNLNDWHHAIGTGAFILTDFVAGSSATMVKNPNYWGHDERYPQNQLPYIDKITYLIIPDDSTALAALRTGKIDMLDGFNYQQAQSVKKTNPEIGQIGTPYSSAVTIDPRNDKAPFNDIRVREALQMAINIPELAGTYYGGTADPWPCPLTSNYLTGWGFPYSQWPQDLKDQYAYNPTSAKKLLADAGYPNGFKTDIVVDTSVDMDLLQIVKSYLTAVGINMDIRPMDSATYAMFVVANHGNDALSQRTAGMLGLTFYPLRHFTKFATGGSSNVAMVSDPTYDAFYTKALASNTTDQIKAILKDCNEYVARHHFAISVIAPNYFSLCQPWLKGFNAQASALSGNPAAQRFFFYSARFWIDSNLKKSLGH